MDIIGGTLSNTFKIKIKVFTPRRAGGINLQGVIEMTKELAQFKYEQLDESTADFLRQKESNMREIVGRAYTELGRELYEAQQRLASHNKYKGVFLQWLAYMEYPQRTAYELIDRYKELLRIPQDMEDTFEALPISLSKTISSPSAESTPEKAQAKSEVLSGEIESLKEYRERIKELECKAEQAEKQAEAERKERERLEQENEKLSNKEPEVITEYIEKETSDPYDRRMDEPYSVERGRDFYEMMNEVDALYKKYAHLKDGIEELRGIAEYDEDLKLKYRKADEFWRMLGEIFSVSNNDIIDVEII